MVVRNATARPIALWFGVKYSWRTRRVCRMPKQNYKKLLSILGPHERKVLEHLSHRFLPESVRTDLIGAKVLRCPLLLFTEGRKYQNLPSRTHKAPATKQLSAKASRWLRLTECVDLEILLLSIVKWRLCGL